MDLSKRKCLSGSHLKWIALISMIIDHVGMVFLNRTSFPVQYTVFRGIGRLAFPIFCFLLVEGFCHTHSFWRYACSLFVFAVISEVPYNLIVSDSISCPEKQNIFFTLLLGLFVMKLLEWKQDFSVRLLILIIAGEFAEVFHLDYEMFGIMQIAGLYLCREKHWIRNEVLILLNLYHGNLQAFGAIAVLPIECYNGERGKQWKYLFYAVYPVHLLLLYLIRKRIGLG